MTKDSLQVPRRPPRARPATARTAAAIIATALALLAAACSSAPSTGSGGSPNAGGSASSQSAVGYSHCMRSRGVPRYPDPSNGVLPKTSAQLLGVSSAQLQAAERACQHLLPADGGALNANSLQQCELTGDCPQALVRQALTEMLRFARCMRSHGVPNWPDPAIGPRGGPYFDLSGHGFSRQQARSAQITRKVNECGHEMPNTGGVPVG